jgi:hypothetical protein
MSANTLFLDWVLTYGLNICAYSSSTCLANLPLFIFYGDYFKQLFKLVKLLFLSEAKLLLFF